jgi:hypothetical protein
MKKMALSSLVFLFATLAISQSPILALPPLPACEDCSCFSNCNQLCIVSHFPDPGSHEEVCDLWLCNQFPECEELDASTFIGEPDFLMTEGINGSCPIGSSSSSDASGEARTALLP